MPMSSTTLLNNSIHLNFTKVVSEIAFEVVLVPLLLVADICQMSTSNDLMVLVVNCFKNLASLNL